MGNITHISKKIFDEVTFLGGWLFFLLMCTFFYIFISVSIAIYSIIVFIFMYIIVYFIRLIYFKERPHKQKYSTRLMKIDASSFPSLHASRITYLVFVLLLLVQFNTIISITLLAIFTLVIYSRIYLKKHYIPDVVGGIILGIISGLGFRLFF